MNKKLKNILACAVGNTLEWFDYTLYGLFATTLAKLFFPTGDDSSIMWTYLVFAFGFFSRPLGGILLGHVGDKFGRKLSLIISIMLMSIPTFLIGLLPTFDSIGIFAPIFLALIRFFQGIAIGGDFTGSMVYLVEHAPPQKRGFFGCWSDFGSPFGVLLGLLVSSVLTSSLNQADFELFGWRIPFLCGIVITIFGIYLRYGMDETESFSNKNLAKEAVPIVETIRKHKNTVIYAVSINAYGGIVFYMLLTYLHNYFKISKIATYQQAFLFTTLVNLFMTVSIPLGGILSDKFTRKKVMISSILITILCAYPMVMTLNAKHLNIHLFFEIIIGICLGIFFGGRAAFYSESFPSHVRCTAIALAFGISHSVFAGTTPLVSEFLIKKTGSCYSLSILISVFAVLALYSLHKSKDRTSKKLL